jgi:putative membrane protein
VNELVSVLPHVNASLNALAAVLLVVGYVLIKQKREAAHKWTMIGCFGVSCVFLACYVTYHVLKQQFTGQAHTSFSKDAGDVIRTVYFTILITHILLAIAVPFLAIITIYSGLKDWRPFHRKIAWWTFPIWLYVSVTGVVVYVMLYHLYPAT